MYSVRKASLWILGELIPQTLATFPAAEQEPNTRDASDNQG